MGAVYKRPTILGLTPDFSPTQLDLQQVASYNLLRWILCRLLSHGVSILIIPEMFFAVFPHMVFRAVIGCVNLIFARFLVDSFLFVFGFIVSYTRCLFTNQR